MLLILHSHIQHSVLREFSNFPRTALAQQSEVISATDDVVDVASVWARGSKCRILFAASPPRPPALTVSSMVTCERNARDTDQMIRYHRIRKHTVFQMLLSNLTSLRS